MQKLSAQTGKTEDELLQEAVNKLIGEIEVKEVKRQERLESLRRARGI